MLTKFWFFVAWKEFLNKNKLTCLLKREVSAKERKECCQKTRKIFLGQTSRLFYTRTRKHISDIKNKKDTANAKHYNSKGNSLSDFKALIIERIIPYDVAWLLEREDFWIKRLETKTPKGLNKPDWKETVLTTHRLAYLCHQWY